MQLTSNITDLEHERAIIDRIYMKLVRTGIIRVNLHEDSYLLEDIEQAVDRLITIQDSYNNVLRK